MLDGSIGTDPIDIYALMKPSMTEDRWKQPIEAYFSHAYNPLDSRDVCGAIQEFASQHGFAVYDMTAQLCKDKIRTMEDLVKLYSTCAKLAVAKPKTLFFIVPNLEIPNSLSVVEGLFALRMSLMCGSFAVFFRDKRGATIKEKKVMRGRCYNLVLFQDDNITSLSNNTIVEIRRQLDDLVAECPICFELLCDINHGAVNYPFECGHAFHDKCVAECKECPNCRTTRRMKGVVTFNMARVG
jgi:hypothetical protein